MKRSLFLLAVIISLTAACAPDAIGQLFFGRKTKWTVPEVKRWAEEAKDQRWHGWLLYQGSDSLYHHFISRYMDETVFFRINRIDIEISDERVYRKPGSSTPLGYYYVDALKDFVKIKDY